MLGGEEERKKKIKQLNKNNNLVFYAQSTIAVI